MNKGFRLSGLTLIALGLAAVVFWLSPAQFPVVLHKLTLAALAAVAGYWIDRHLFPYARPHLMPKSQWPMIMLRRAIIVAAAILGVALGL